MWICWHATIKLRRIHRAPFVQNILFVPSDGLIEKSKGVHLDLSYFVWSVRLFAWYASNR